MTGPFKYLLRFPVNILYKPCIQRVHGQMLTPLPDFHHRVIPRIFCHHLLTPNFLFVNFAILSPRHVLYEKYVVPYTPHAIYPVLRFSPHTR